MFFPFGSKNLDYSVGSSFDIKNFRKLLAITKNYSPPKHQLIIIKNKYSNEMKAFIGHMHNIKFRTQYKFHNKRITLASRELFGYEFGSLR